MKSEFLLGVMATLLFIGSIGAWFTVSYKVDMDFETALAAGELAGDWPTAFTVNKFGANGDIDTTEESVWQGNDFGGPARCFGHFAIGATLNVSSDDAGDTDKNVVIEGIDSNYEPVTVTAALDGTSFVSLGVTNWRGVNRAYAEDEGFDGNVYIHTDVADGGADGIPDIPSTQLVQVITAGEDQTLMACYLIPAGFNAMLTSWCKSNVTQAAASTAVTFRWRKTEPSKTARNQHMITLGDEITECSEVHPPAKFTEKTLIEVTGSDATSQAASASFGLLLLPNDL